MGEVPFIAVEGPIGVGKTSFAMKLAAHFQFHILKEIVEENPFLNNFYDNIDEWSFQTEMFFLCNRYKQLEDIEKYFLHRGKSVIADYHIVKNRIFAKRTLKETQFIKYEQIYDILTTDLPQPNLIVYLDARLDTLIHQIRSRNRGIEHNIQSSYLEQLSKDYQEFMGQFEVLHPSIPIVRFNVDDLDFINNQKDLDFMINKVNKHLQQGRSS
ncbi:deoxynucleoside kinase [Aquibacillus sp. 3ASR75-11]|uniref:Deoxynucleoside kinase n=1 Tax=Terrihalobacillus insolitus TaxID=2950438 RepID=A0A9X4AQ14_9BACI|nr:deoxynucleoside kinase [Terrihalobacillus insolitus]MDC3415256.1 deoxynucleoside kinase [Terrihalobacillus insolitus]MDC3426100.1 deoxynucleoside kinase [Terrihalobacillus insolitus]